MDSIATTVPQGAQGNIENARGSSCLYMAEANLSRENLVLWTWLKISDGHVDDQRQRPGNLSGAYQGRFLSEVIQKIVHGK